MIRVGIQSGINQGIRIGISQWIRNGWRTEIPLPPWIAMQPETITQKNRIESDGGTVIDLPWMNRVISNLKAQGIYTSCKLLTDANFGVKKNPSTGAVSKLYDISGNNNDAVQAAGANQPVWSLVNGRGVITYDGVNDELVWGNKDYGTTHSFYAGVSQAVSGDKVWIGTVGNPNNYVFDYVTNTWKYTTPESVSSSSDIFSTAWRSMLIVRNNTSVKFYKNGGAIGTSTLSANNSLIVGKIGYDISLYRPKGSMRWLLIFSTALSDSNRQILESLFNSYYSIY